MWRAPTVRRRPALRKSVAGRLNSRADAPTIGASTAIVSPGFADTARYKRSPSAAMSADGRFVPIRLGAAGVDRSGVFAASENARSRASCAALRLAVMCSCTNRSMRAPRSQFVFVMRAESHDLDHALNTTPERLPSWVLRPSAMHDEVTPSWVLRPSVMHEGATPHGSYAHRSCMKG